MILYAYIICRYHVYQLFYTYSISERIHVYLFFMIMNRAGN